MQSVPFTLNAECALHTGTSSMVLAWPLVFELLVRTAVVEKHVSCQHHRKPSEAPFLYTDILIVILVVTSLKCSSNAFRGEILHQYPAWQLPYFDIQELLFLQWYD